MDKIQGAPVSPMLTQRVGDLKISTKAPKVNAGEDQSTGSDTKPMDTVAITQAMAGLGQNLEVGEKVTLKVGKEAVAEVVKEGESNWDRFANGVGRMGKATMMEAQELIETDPAFAFREGVETVKDTLTQAAPEPVRNLAISGLYPGVRAGVFALDVYKAWRTFKDPNAGLAEKIINTGHCITDLGGLVAAAAPLVGLAIPGANIIAAVAYTADIISFAFHGLGYFGNKVRKWRANKAAKEEENQGAQKPQPNETQKPEEAIETKKS